MTPAPDRWPRPAALAGFCALAAFSLSLPCHAAEAVADPTGFTCTFEGGSSHSYSDGRFKAQHAEPLKFGISAVDLESRKALLVTAGGNGPLRIVRAVGANHYLEVVTEGYLNVTTIYALDQKRHAYPAVHSRHIGLFGEPLVAQYVGFCTALPQSKPSTATAGKTGKAKQ